MAGAENSVSSTLIEVADLAKTFGRRQALADVDLTLNAGEVMGFVGPNGAGKTTTLRILAGLLKADRGTGHVLGAPVRGGRDAIRSLAERARGFAATSAAAASMGLAVTISSSSYGAH